MLLHRCITYIFVCVFRSQASTGPQAKQDGLREEVEEAWRRLESIKVPVFPSFVARIQPEALNLVLTPDLSVFLSLQDQYSADLYHFATKEEDYANYFIRVSRSCDGSIYFSPECGDNNLISQEKKKKSTKSAYSSHFRFTSLVSPAIASRAASRVPQKFTRVPEQKHQRAQRESQPERWGYLAAVYAFIWCIVIWIISCVLLACVPISSLCLSDSTGPPINLSNQKVYGEPLLSHLSQSNREIAAPIQECIHMLLRTGMSEEVGLTGSEFT